jgi:Na+-transporting NADH:ubiquinone oxidoreductase subunit NqrF
MLANVQLLETAIQGRNRVAHAELIAVATHWESYLKSWEDVCTLISNPTAAQNISAFHAELKAQRNVPFTTGSFLSGPMKASIRSKTMIRIKLTKKPV